MKQFLVIAFIALIFIGCASKSPTQNIQPTPYQVNFTTGINDDLNPVNDVKEISLDEDEIYIYVKWNLPLISRVQTTKIFDGENNLLESPEFKFTPTTTNWHTWTGHKIKKSDKAGIWKFQIFSDGKLAVEKTIKVTESKSDAKSNSL